MGIPFRAASKGNKQTKRMLGNTHDPIERARDAAKTPGEKSTKKRQINGITPDITMDVRNAGVQGAGDLGLGEFVIFSKKRLFFRVKL